MDINRREAMQAAAASLMLPCLPNAALGDNTQRPRDYRGYSHIEIYDGPMPSSPGLKPEGNLLAEVPFIRYDPGENGHVRGYWEGAGVQAGVISFFRVVMKNGEAMLDTSGITMNTDYLFACSDIELRTDHLDPSRPWPEFVAN